MASEQELLQLSEDAQVTLAFQTENRLSLYLAFSDRRVEEVKDLNNLGQVPPDTIADRLQQELNSALVLAANMPEQDEGQALTRMQVNVRRQQQKLGEVASHVADPAEPVLARVQSALADHLTLVEMGLTDPPGLQKHLHGRGNLSTPPGQGKHGTGNPPGQEQRPPVPPGKEQHTLTPSAQERRAATPTTTRRQPALTPTPKAQGGGKGK